jgi:hypothetical protein
MKEFLPEGRVVSTMWGGEANKYRDHLLPLDPQSRDTRFNSKLSLDFERAVSGFGSSRSNTFVTSRGQS